MEVILRLQLTTLNYACCIAAAATIASATPATAQISQIYTFAGLANGANPQSGVIADATGALYGTTALGGSHTRGTVYKLTPPVVAGTPWTKTILWNFIGKTDGSYPYAPVMMDATGALYGTTETGGIHNEGTVYRLSPPAAGKTAWTETTLFNFNGAAGSYPSAGLVMDATGALYGVTLGGGKTSNGIVFKLTPPASGTGGWAPTVLHDFAGGNYDGAMPNGSLALDAAGNIYGTTESGGAANLGIVFRLSPIAGSKALKFAMLHQFTANINGNIGPDGASPYGSVLIDNNGSLYGTAFAGGVNNGGVAWMLSPPAAGKTAWGRTLLWQFGAGSDGFSPTGGLVADSAGALYGTTSFGGAYGDGAVFKLTPPVAGSKAWTETLLYSPNLLAGQGANPGSNLAFDQAGDLIGTTPTVTPSFGNVFAVAP
jgi:uncharacterized repeat protein (TIGR03803 family)